MARILTCIALLAAPAAAESWLELRPPAREGHAYPELYCMNRGERVALGETTCVRTNCCPVSGCEVFVARCELSTNNPTFRKLSDGCPEGLSRAPRATPPRAPG